MNENQSITLQEIPYRVSIAMQGADCAQVAAAAAEYLPSGAMCKSDEGTWLVEDNLERTWVVIDGVDDLDSMFDKPTARCILVSPVLAYEDMGDLFGLLREIRSSTGARGGASCGMRVYAFPGKGQSWRGGNLRTLVNNRLPLLLKVLNPDLEGFRPHVEERINQLIFDARDICEVLPCDAASSLDPDEAKDALQLALAITAQAVNQKRVYVKRNQPENGRYAFRCWMLKMGLSGDEYKSMRQRFLKRLPGDSAMKIPRSSNETGENSILEL